METFKKERFSKSIGYLFFSQGLIKILGLTYSLYLINKSCFGDKGNAIYLSAYQIFSLVLTFSAMGVPNAVSNMIAQSSNYSMINKVFKTAVIVYLIIACCGGLGLFIFSDVIACKFLGIHKVNYHLKILSPIVIAVALESIHVGYFNGLKQMKITAKIQFLEQLFKTLFTIGIVEVLSKFTSDPYILSLGATIAVSSSIILSFVMCFVEKRKIQVIAKDLSENCMSFKEIAIKLLSFSVPVSIGAMLVAISKNSDSFTIINILGKKIGIDYAQELYGIIASKVDVLIILPLAFNITFSTALIPNISEAKRFSKDNYIKKYVEYSVFMSLIIGIGSMLGLYFFAEDVFDLLFSNSKNGVDLLKLSSFSIVFSALNQTFIGILQGIEKHKIPVIANVIGCLVKVIFNIVLVSCDSIGIKGIILSNIISNCVVFIILLKKVRKFLKFKFKRYVISIFLVVFISIFLILQIKKILIFLNFAATTSFIGAVGVGGSFLLVELWVVSKIFNISGEINDIKK